MYELSLFSGIGGGLLATKWLLGWETICYVEWEQYCIDVLKARIKDGLLDDAPIWDNIQTFRKDNPECRQFINQLAQIENLVITAGFPCQPFSTAGKRKAAKDKRNMWPDTIRVIKEVQPRWVFLENVPGLLSAMDKESTFPHSYFGTILGDLAQSGYNARWKVLSAAELGAPHKRDRIFIVAYAKQERLCRQYETTRLGRARASSCKKGKYKWWETEPQLGRVANGIPHQMDRLKALGNGQVPIVVKTVWELLTSDLDIQ